jgi:hypothetical protein
MKVELEVNRKVYKGEGKDAIEALDSLGLGIFDVKTKSVIRFKDKGKTYEQYYPLHRLRNILRQGSALRKGLPLVLSKYFDLK